MSNTVIQVENLAKQYRLGKIGTGSLAHDVNRWWYRFRGKEDPYLKIGEVNERSIRSTSDYVWSLQDINFSIRQGEVLGIIGRNGAGKSTLLKILSRTTTPTRGRVKIRGRLASLLEVGTGFHPELTGRENIFLNGAILGMTRAEIARKFDEIVEFAGVARYIDTPVKRYSSGMYVRLAFAVAAHLEPEILIVDEVLAVGDAEFQNKCLGKMKDVSDKEGRTVLFVSHNMGAIRNLCTHSILLKQGLLVKEGHPADVIDAYLSGDNEVERYISYDESSRPRCSELELSSIRIVDEKGRLDNLLTTADSLNVEIAYLLHQPIKDLRVVLNLYTTDGNLIFTTSDFNFQSDLRIREKGQYTSVCFIPGNLLNAGRYIVRVDFDIPKIKALIMGIALDFTITEVINNQLGITLANKPPGIIHPIVPWEIQHA